MAPKTDEKSIEVRDSIEAKGANDEDVEMEDAGDQMDIDADADADAEGEEDAEGEPDDGEPSRSSSDPKNLLQVIDNTSQYLCNYTEEYVFTGPCTYLRKCAGLTFRCIGASDSDNCFQWRGNCCWLPAHPEQTAAS